MNRQPVLVYVSGEGWDDIAGTNRHLAEALARIRPVLWVDPAVSVAGRIRQRRAGVRPTPTGLSNPAPGLTRLHVAGPPGLTRPILSTLSERHVATEIDLALRRLDAFCDGVVLTSPILRFPPVLDRRRLLYVTDDWMSGAHMMGFDTAMVRRAMSHNAFNAQAVAAVTPSLAAKVAELIVPAPTVQVLPNGCEPMTDNHRIPVDLPPGPLVALVGQLNERLDYDVLERVAHSGVTVVMIGPRTERTRAVSRRLDTLFAMPTVHWVGSVPAADLPSYLDRMTLGITPYADNDFNRSSFPLKTLEYLSHGLPVVATDLPAARWLGTPHIDIATSPAEFAELVVRRVASAPDRHEIDRKRFARLHSWDERAASLLKLIDPREPRRRPVTPEGRADLPTVDSALGVAVATQEEADRSHA
ncbi:hypothetical protein GCM10007304_00370 [Rhodococcoides trifolii]|uniref:Glycosyltransferase n=1 Tax=Rhodococcoides trifolii TaxID=908250 RepID=A0A917FMT2_9NOCA|nr:glycosyltransferase [Rhodococcus trifolii]GGF90415.1 hypothetical protein GCM10007304_00370 [Rhodococcus trifolii]